MPVYRELDSRDFHHAMKGAKMKKRLFVLALMVFVLVPLEAIAAPLRPFIKS